MKALPDNTDSEHRVKTVDAIDERGTVDEYQYISSSKSEADDGENWSEKECRETLDEEDEDNNNRRKSKKKHKKHHHKHRDDSRIRKKHKKRKKRVDPIFLWAQKKEAKIVRVVCENYDRHNRIRLVRTPSGVWTSNPRSKVLQAATQSRASVYDYEDESQNHTEEETADELEKQPSQHSQPKLEEKPKESEQKLVDLNDNSIDFVDIISSDDDEEEQRARIDRALEMIDQDPALMEDVKIELPNIGTATLKLPEGTTIHQVKVEKTIDTPITPTLSPTKTMAQCMLGELTIIPPQQQNEPLNLETVGKRSALEIRLQEPPLKKKRVVEPLQPTLVSEPVKHEWDPLSELKEVLSDPRLSVPDPLLVPRARLAALVASPATEIPKLLQTPSLLPPPDPDLLAVSISHLWSILQQQPGFTDENKAEGNQSSNIDQMLWLSYLSSKDMTSVDADLLTNMLNLLLPNSTTPQQSYNYPQQKNQWNDIYYGGNLAPPYVSTPGYSKPDDCCASVSPLPPPTQISSPLLQKQQQPSLLPPQPQQKSQLPPSLPQKKSQQPLLPVQPIKQRVCQDLCCNGSPSMCYESCCTKANGYNPFIVSPNGCNPFAVSPSGCNPFIVSPTGCANNLNSCTARCTTFSTDGTTCCFSSEMGCGYNGQSLSPMTEKPSASPCSRIQCSNYQTQNQTGMQPSMIPECSASGGSVSNIGGDNKMAEKPQTPLPLPDVSTSSGEAVKKPLQKAKIKVKQHLIDPNAKPNLINIQGALHMAGAGVTPHDLLSSSLWHPLFGSQEKPYGCRWQWTTPVTKSPPSNSSDISDKR